MSILGLFDIGKSALFASQTALSVVSNNIANVNTPGYSKQDVVLDIANPVGTSAGYIGAGVTVAGIMRNYDRFIQAQLLGQQQSQSRSSAMDQAWGQVEQLLNEQQGAGLSGPLSDFFNAWNDVATAPESPAARAVLLQKAGALTRSASTIERGIVDTLNNANATITDSARQINALASDIAALNGQISLEEAGQTTEKAIDLRDQRDSKLTELAKLVDFSTYEDSNGSLTVAVGMRNLVSGVTTNPMSTAANTNGNQDVYLDGINITSNIQGGQLGGLIASRDDIQSSALTGLRKLIASVTQQVNSLHTQGFGLDGSTGNDFFNPLQLSTVNNSAGASIAATVTNEAALTLDEYNITFAGGNYNVYNKQTGALVTSGAYISGATISLSGMDVVISGAVTSTDSFTVSPLATAVSNFGVALSDPQKIAASSTAAGIPGDNTMALQISQLADAAVGDLGNTTFSEYYGALVSTVGAMKQSAADSLTFDNNLLTALQNRRDSVSGVSLDEEAANLIRYQRSYEAGARMIKVADELLQTILNL